MYVKKYPFLKICTVLCMNIQSIDQGLCKNSAVGNNDTSQQEGIRVQAHQPHFCVWMLIWVMGKGLIQA